MPNQLLLQPNQNLLHTHCFFLKIPSPHIILWLLNPDLKSHLSVYFFHTLMQVHGLVLTRCMCTKIKNSFGITMIKMSILVKSGFIISDMEHVMLRAVDLIIAVVRYWCSSKNKKDKFLQNRSYFWEVIRCKINSTEKVYLIKFRTC